jgi:hypothetical protein
MGHRAFIDVGHGKTICGENKNHRNQNQYIQQFNTETT